MKNIQKLSLGLLLIAGASTTQTEDGTYTPHSLGSAISNGPAAIGDYTVGAPVTAQRNKDIKNGTKSKDDKTLFQAILTPVTVAGDTVQVVGTAGQTHPFEEDFGSHDDNNVKTKSGKKSSRKKSRQNNDDDSMTGTQAESLD